uniref:IPPc domain-containing protein n=1 Tax=Heterorhabditis bacteriophora TaxID=37862 RepID=A0A1I7XF41_HETBA
MAYWVGFHGCNTGVKSNCWINSDVSLWHAHHSLGIYYIIESVRSHYLLTLMTFYTPGKKNGYVPGRDPMVDEVMRNWQERLQEMDLSVGTYLIDNTKKMEEWLDCIQASLPGGSRNFNLISSMRLVGIFIVLFQSRASTIRVSDVNSNYIATGISVLVNKLGNKGGTAISLRMNDTLVCFVNCHLAAGNSELERRNQDFRDISQLSFPNGLSIYDHDAVFWFGDLNYRINSESPGWSGEQLREQQLLGRVFVGFNEPGNLPFRPTYKYDVGTSNWDSSEKARAPAWCDRVLWWTRDRDTHVLQSRYESIEQISISDHKPVRANFQVNLRSIDQNKADYLYDEAIREADRRANELLPQISLKPFCRLITIKNTGKSQVRFSFMVRTERGVCAKWLQVTPPYYTIPIGQSTQISLTVVIDKEIAWELTDTKLQDILVMNLENGRDYFIPVTAEYYPRCYGVTLEQLLNNKRKKEENLIDFGDVDECIPDLCPIQVPREVYRLISALRILGAEKLDFNDVVDNSAFIRIRNALEQDYPKDLTQLNVSPLSVYSSLLRLIDTMKYPLFPHNRHREMRDACNDPSLLWAIILSLPPANTALIEYLIDYIRELIAQKPSARDQLLSWADVMFRDRPDPMVPLARTTLCDPRISVLQSLYAYGKDVVMFRG